MTFKPISAKWLSPAFDHLIYPYPELMVAYKLPDYPGAMEGESNWIDMYLDEEREHPVGRLWVNPENDGCGVVALPVSDLTYLTRDALRLRVFHALTFGCSMRSTASRRSTTQARRRPAIWPRPMFLSRRTTSERSSFGAVPRRAVRLRSRRAEFVGVLCRKIDLVGHSVESERNRSDVPRHDIAAQLADARLDAKPSRVLLKAFAKRTTLWKPQTPAKNGSRCGISPGSGEHPESSRIRGRFRVLFG
jgi:hypothetical protein